MPDVGLLSLALVTDTHYWLPSAARSEFVARTNAASERDGLLVHRSPQVLAQLFAELSGFAGRGGTAGVHLGDSVCGGGGFSAPASEYRSSLAAVRALEDRGLPNGWPFYHIPGNHDVAPAPIRGHAAPGLEAWRSTFAPVVSSAQHTASGRVDAATHGALPPGHVTQQPVYRTLPLPGNGTAAAAAAAAAWRVLLLDSMDGVTTDEDGHGSIGAEQLAWLDTQLQAAHAAGVNVVLLSHQLLVDPTAPDDDERRRERKRRLSDGGRGGDLSWLGPGEPSGSSGPSWIGEGDMVRNRAEVLRVVARYPGTIRLALAGHVHANTLVRWHGIPFVSLASTSEWPMQWHELLLGPCTLRLLQHDLRLPPATRLESMRRDSRPNRNRIKLGLARRPHGATPDVMMASTVETEADALAPTATTLEASLC